MTLVQMVEPCLERRESIVGQAKAQQLLDKRLHNLHVFYVKHCMSHAHCSRAETRMGMPGDKFLVGRLSIDKRLDSVARRVMERDSSFDKSRFRFFARQLSHFYPRFFDFFGQFVQVVATGDFKPQRRLWNLARHEPPQCSIVHSKTQAGVLLSEHEAQNALAVVFPFCELVCFENDVAERLEQRGHFILWRWVLLKLVSRCTSKIELRGL